MAQRGSQASGSKEARKELTVVVPTYNETLNIRPLCERLFKTVKETDLTVELLFVDDESKGSDETEKIVKELSKDYPVRIHCRKKVEGRGLSSAVMLGFAKAKYSTVLCMDADLQHEPESVPNVARPVLEGDAEFSVGSRNADGGGYGFEWSFHRQVLSKGATMLSWGVANSDDPMSGFFCVTKEVLKRGEAKINQKGFKIGLEVMARCKCQPVANVGITFQERAEGESKMSGKEIKFYLEQLGCLYWDRYGLLLVALFLFLLFVAFFVLRTGVRMIR